MRRIRVVALSVVLIILGSLVFPGLSKSPVGAVDFLQYWSAAHLFFEGNNPYDVSLLEAVQRGVWDRDAMRLPIIMYNPPFILPFLFPLRFVSFSLGVGLWSLSIVICLLWSYVLLVRAGFCDRGWKPISLGLLSSSLYALSINKKNLPGGLDSSLDSL